ncbi:MAG TPA: primase-helicase zinc-binding domain-containing protein [Pirellulaceae bacterium]|nr:primase-helicase zinc-binding domain-containing protein [Pirellulaceae bacterium]
MSANGFKYEVADVKAAARGRWPEVLQAVGIPRDTLDGRHHACPKCGGTDRFRLVDEEAGAVFCNACFSSANGDGLAAIRWMRGCNFGDAIEFAAGCLNLTPQNGHATGHAATFDPIEAVCQAKRMPRESALAYGARAVAGGVAFPSWGPDCEPMGDFIIKPKGGEKQRKGMWALGCKAGVFLPVVDGQPQKPQPGETWLVFEGVKDPAAARSLGYQALGLNGCKLNQRFAKLLRGCDVVFVPDRDVPSIDGMKSAARKLYGIAASIKIATLPAEVTPTDGKDVRDILALADGESLVREAIDTAMPFEVERPQGGPDSRVPIYDGPKEHDVSDQAIVALAELPGLYQRGGNLVSIVSDPPAPKGIIRPPGGLYIEPVTEAGLIDRLSQVVRFYRLRKSPDGDLVEYDVPPPTRIAKIIMARRHWPGLPALESVVHSPVFLADGSVLATPGYCRQTGLYLSASCEFPPVPHSPTLADAEDARDEILDVVCDFPFASEAHKAAWFAMALTPAARFAFDGPNPLFAVDANVRGSGKSMLCDVVGMIYGGDSLPRTAPPVCDEEFRKRITSILLAGEQIVLIDNVTGTLGGAALDALLTSSTWSDRILGQSRMTGKLAAKTIWWVTGNNLIYEADTGRRVLTARLQCQEENPEERTGFRHPNLLAWVKANRGRLAVAAVTILRAYHVAGGPKMSLPEWGSFEGWSELVRGAVVWVGLEDPGQTRIEVREQSDREAGILRQLLTAWISGDASGFGMTVAEAIGKAASGHLQLQAVFSEIGQPGKPVNPRSVGMKLNHIRGRVCGGRFFERYRNSENTTVWKVQRVETSGTTGTTGTTLNPPAGASGNSHVSHTYIDGAGNSSASSPSSGEF